MLPSRDGPWKGPGSREEGGAHGDATLATARKRAVFRGGDYFTQQSTGQTPEHAGVSFCPTHSVHLAASMT
jgi:hypothetical protein